MTVQVRKPERREPRSSEEIRYLYVDQLQDELQRYQDASDRELDEWLQTLSDEDREMMADYIQQQCDDPRPWEVEMFDAGECAFLHENVFAFRMPKHWVCDHRVLEILGKPDVCWSFPDVNIGIKDMLAGTEYLLNHPINLEEWDNHLVITVMLVDG